MRPFIELLCFRCACVYWQELGRQVAIGVGRRAFLLLAQVATAQPACAPAWQSAPGWHPHFRSCPSLQTRWRPKWMPSSTPTWQRWMGRRMPSSPAASACCRGWGRSRAWCGLGTGTGDARHSWAVGSACENRWRSGAWKLFCSSEAVWQPPTCTQQPASLNPYCSASPSPHAGAGAAVREQRG